MDGLELAATIGVTFFKGKLPIVLERVHSIVSFFYIRYSFERFLIRSTRILLWTVKLI